MWAERRCGDDSLIITVHLNLITMCPSEQDKATPKAFKWWLEIGFSSLKSALGLQCCSSSVMEIETQARVAKFSLTPTLCCAKTSRAWFHKSKLCVLSWNPHMGLVVNERFDVQRNFIRGKISVDFGKSLMRLSGSRWWGSCAHFSPGRYDSSTNQQSLTSPVRNNCRKHRELIFINRLLFVVFTKETAQGEYHFCSTEPSWHK